MSGAPGAVVLFGSGETGHLGHDAVRWLAATGRVPRRVAVLETPAGFEANAEAVARRWTETLAQQPELRRAHVEQLPIGRRGAPGSDPDDPRVAAPLLAADLIAMGAGSPTYAVRTLAGTRAWAHVECAHLLGTSLFLASAAAVAVGTWALPVYEIFKVGDDPHWKPGLALFERYGARIAVVPHWNNATGGEVDTSHCFVGRERFAALVAELPADAVLIGIDEHTALAIDPQAGCAVALGGGRVTLRRSGREREVERGDTLELADLGLTVVPDASILDPDVVGSAQAARAAPAVPADVDGLVAERDAARRRGDWPAADALRERIGSRGWSVKDDADGPHLERRRGQ